MRQLRVAYNPKVSSFKTKISETSTDTLGNKYPFFFRNSAIQYKEIGLSGMLSYHLDSDFFFINPNELNIKPDEQRRITPTDKQKDVERKLKIKGLTLNQENEHCFSYVGSVDENEAGRVL
jgi:hypothetical protein